MCQRILRRGLRGARLDQLAQFLARAGVVEADVEARARLGGDQVHGLVADVDRGELEVRCAEMRGAAVDRLGVDRDHQRRDVAHRVVGELRIGDVALRAGHDQRAVLRAAPADLHHVAELLRVGRLAQNGVIEFLAALRRPFQKLHGAVDRDAFLVAGDEERDRALRLAAVGCEIVERRCDLARDRALHVDRAAAVEHVARDLARERRMRPLRLIARRHHVGVAGQHQMRRRGADARVEILDRVGAGLLEGDAMHREARALEHRLDDGERAALRRRHRGAADQIACEGDRIGHV